MAKPQNQPHPVPILPHPSSDVFAFPDKPIISNFHHVENYRDLMNSLLIVWLLVPPLSMSSALLPITPKQQALS